MSAFKPGEILYAGNTRVEFVKYLENRPGNSAIIRVGMDTRLVDPVTLRRAAR